jgi:predicted transglutaminase-like cysteine proteinase
LRGWRAAHAIALTVSAFASANLSAAETKLAADTPATLASAPTRLGGEVDPFASDPLLGGKRLVSDKLKSLPQWDRVRLFMVDRHNLSQPELQALIDWARGLQNTPPRDRLYAVNTRVNKEFKYVIDPRVWDKPDYWATPVENDEKLRMDCEDYASVKLYLLYVSGIAPQNLALMVGKIPSTGEAHAVLAVAMDNVGYVLDNRTPYVVNTYSFSDFRLYYAVNFYKLWIYPAALKK